MKHTHLRYVLLTGLFAAPAIAQAHPGHDGDHDFVWDFGHFASHPVATLMGFAVVAAAGWLTWRILQAPKSIARVRQDDKRR